MNQPTTTPGVPTTTPNPAPVTAAANPQTTGPDGLIVETLAEPQLGTNVTVRELFIKDAKKALADAQEQGQHRGMALLSAALQVDGKRMTVDDMDNLPARKLGAVMRAVDVALRLNGLNDKDGDTAADAVKNA